MELRIRQGRPSHTAWLTAVARARHQVLEGGRVFKDPLALRILGPEQAARLQADGRAGQSLASRLLGGPVAARSRIAEDTLAEAVAAGCTQYVLLGTGLDTFALRNPWPGRLQVFELDHPATLAWRQAQLQAAGLTSPGVPVPIDFETQDVFDCLRGAGLQPGRPVVFAWLGVSVYLPPEATWRMLQAVGRTSAPGSVLVFDYLRRPSAPNLPRRLALALLARRFARLGEPWRGLLPEGELRAHLAAAGFRRTEFLDPVRLARRLMAEGRAEGLADAGGRAAATPASGAGPMGGVVRAWC